MMEKEGNMKNKKIERKRPIINKGKWDRDYLIKVTQSNINAGRIKIIRGAAPYSSMSTLDCPGQQQFFAGRRTSSFARDNVVPSCSEIVVTDKRL
jgi:hypothetical protein